MDKALATTMKSSSVIAPISSALDNWPGYCSSAANCWRPASAMAGGHLTSRRATPEGGRVEVLLILGICILAFIAVR